MVTFEGAIFVVKRSSSVSALSGPHPRAMYSPFVAARTLEMNFLGNMR